MLIVGELINSSRKAIRPAIEQKDSKFIQNLAIQQLEAGASYIDVNCGTEIYEEKETIQWLVRSILEVCKAPLCIDSPSTKVLSAGLEVAQQNGKQQMVNSITAESKRYTEVIPLIQMYKTKVIALCMDDNGIPETFKDRIQIADKLINDLTRDEIEQENIYIDPLVKPISTGDQFGKDVLETIRYIRKEYPKVHTICGLSNVSFGLPNRNIFNRVFMIQTMTMGMDSYILDPTDSEMMGLIYASEALLGLDPYCMNYLKAYRKGFRNINIT